MSAGSISSLGPSSLSAAEDKALSTIKVPKCFPLVLKKKKRQSTLEAGTRQNSVFPDVPPAWKALSCLSAQPVCVSDTVLTFWAVTQRHPEVAPRDCIHIWPPRPTQRFPAFTSPRHPYFFFLHPLITNTCGLAVPPTAAKPPDCFSL